MPPKKLYKYQSFNELSLKNLKDQKIYFNSPLNFNDPYESLNPLTYSPLSNNSKAKVLAQISGISNAESTILKFLENEIDIQDLAQMHEIMLTLNPANAEAILKSNDIEKDDYLNPSENLLDNPDLLNAIIQGLQQSIFSVFDESVQRVMKNLRKQSSKEYGVSCFSDSSDNMLLWSYYADGHKGFCLEFDTNYDPFRKAIKVRYVKESLEFPVDKLMNGKIDSTDLLTLLFGTKNILWEHEREWRTFHKNNAQLYGYETSSLTGIYFGSEMQDSTREILLTVLKAQNPFVKFYRMQKVDSTFKVQSEEFDYQTHLEGQDNFKLELIRVFGEREFSNSDLIEAFSDTSFLPLLDIYIKNLNHLNLLKSNDGKRWKLMLNQKV